MRRASSVFLVLILGIGGLPACKRSKATSISPVASASAASAFSLSSASAKALAAKLENAEKQADVEAALVSVRMPIAARGDAERYLAEIGALTACEPDDEGKEATCHFTAKIKEKIDPHRTEAHWDCLDEQGAPLRKGYYLGLFHYEDENVGEPVRFDVPMRECWEKGGTSIRLTFEASADAGAKNAGTGTSSREMPAADLYGAIPWSNDAIPDSDAWALYAPGTTDCGVAKAGDPPKRVDQPEAADEFEKRKLIASRKDIAAKYIGKIFYVEDEGAVDRSDTATGTKDYSIWLSKYDFNAKQYTVKLRANEDSHLPIGGTDPIFTREAHNIASDQEIARLGGKKLTVRTQNEIGTWWNKSSLAFPVKMTETEAEQWKEGARGAYRVYLKLIGLGWHNACAPDCFDMPFGGGRTCMQVNQGRERYVRAETVGYRVEINGKLVANKEPPKVAASSKP